VVTGGTFYRSYDGVFYTDTSKPATVSDFRLDKFEITVGRFREFVDAVVRGWRPQVGSGKHKHLNGGEGLVSDLGGYETGWPAADVGFPTTGIDWDFRLRCNPITQTWTVTPGTNENQPLTCATWPELYAFCIWDDGFLPSEAELNYAAAGGSEQRVYPWSVPPSSTAIDCSYVNHRTGPNAFCLESTQPVGSKSPLSDGKFGQADLAGNVREWTVDTSSNHPMPCIDCCAGGAPSYQMIRGGDYRFSAAEMRVSARETQISWERLALGGARCARVP